MSETKVESEGQVLPGASKSDSEAPVLAGEKRRGRQTFRYAVTFEFDTRAPLTHRGTVTAWSYATCFARAVREAHKTMRPINASSVSAVLLERVEA